MAKNKAARVACRALEYLEPVHPPDLQTEDSALRYFLNSTAGSPARAGIEARSDHSFVDGVIKELVSSGLDHERACAAAAAVLATPTMAAQRRNGSDAGAHHAIVQSVVLTRPEPESTELQVVVRLVSRGGKPPVIELIDVAVEPFDLADRHEVLSLVACVEAWSRELPMPSHVFPNPLPLPEWAWLGDLTWAGLLELPADWRDRLKSVGGVYGRVPLIAESAEAAAQYKVAERTGFVVSTPASKWATDLHIPEDSGCEVESIGKEATTFEDLLRDLRDLLHAKAAAANAPTPSSRDIEKSEIVYHRKVGDSRGGYDHFDEGTTKACRHGASSFVGWGGDKATKGMARRYDNFTPAMLIHCGKYPNCNVYGIDAARGGHKLDDDSDAASDA